ncbi:MAG TPA: DUF1080 domain-containing protein [Bryobacteraceae bacterium]|jgi:hypothetical protein|nr:DUF1080 domain-containing protein [Bryobacteraceae bacterium]
MRIRYILPLALTAFAASVPVIKWKTGDRSRPLPPVVTPGEAGTQEHAGTAPSDAVQLFNGKDLSGWQQRNGKPIAWKVGDGYFEDVPGTGDIVTKQPFGDCQLHVEWATPNPAHGKDQEPGNSGVYLHSLYEIQVLESNRNTTYADGQAGAIYCQYPPLVNPARPPGEWQTYDIVFHGPRFSADSKLLEPATVTLLFNGVLAQDHAMPTGPTDYMKRPPYKVTPPKLPLMLQDHGQPVRYRNIWIRELRTAE